MYALIITDGDVCCCTTHTFERQDLWDWMNQQVDFPPGAVNVDIPMPAGYPQEFNEAPTPEGGWPAGSAHSQHHHGLGERPCPGSGPRRLR